MYRHLGIMGHEGSMAVTPAMEEAATGRPNNETELVFYARLQDRSVLESASVVEDQEQWEIRIFKTDDNALAGRMRNRKTTPVSPMPGEAEYVFTSKTKAARGETEVANPSSEAAFLQFKGMAPKGMVKRRYVFDILGRSEKWEVDTYLDRDGTPSDWVKIDLEITKADFTLPEFPAGLIDESTLMRMGDRSQEIQDKIAFLYESVFITKNTGL
jgi:hypothetical protein